MIEIPESGDASHRMWQELIRLGEDPPAPWTLIGAHMVALHGWAKGREQIRPSRDADVLVNARAVADGTAKLSQTLVDRGYTLDGVSPDGVGHRFVREGVIIDVLGPDGMGERANLETLGGAHTVRVPGGTQALRRSEPAEVRTRSTSGFIPLPDILGAILVKVRAIAVDDEPQVQRRDTAFLLSLVEDPDALVEDLTPTERGWLRRHPYLADPTSQPYAGLANAEDAAIVYRRLARV